MRLRTLTNRLIWLGLVGYVGYAALLAASSYFYVKETVEQAVTEAREAIESLGALLRFR